MKTELFVKPGVEEELFLEVNKKGALYQTGVEEELFLEVNENGAFIKLG